MPDAVQMGPDCGKNDGKPSSHAMTGISNFVQQTHNFIAAW
jgi:hypothetical protein